MAAEADSKTENKAEKTTKGTPPRATRKCSVEGCKRPYRAKTYCVVHYNTWRRGEMESHKARYKACSKEGCKKPAGRWGQCDEHGKTGAAESAAEAPAT
jgi:hypothetical protein